MIEDGEDTKPYIRVHESSPIYYSKDGKIFEHGHIFQYIPLRENKYLKEEIALQKQKKTT